LRFTQTQSLSIKENIMKASILFATGLILAAGAVFGSTNIAQAGAGGSTGSISAEFATGNVLKATAGAVSVGKAGSITGATGTANEITASSVGYAGALTVGSFNTAVVDYGVAAETDGNVALLQGNLFGGTTKSSVNLVPGAGTGVNLQ
jgi:hypothetical protein